MLMHGIDDVLLLLELGDDELARGGLLHVHRELLDHRSRAVVRVRLLERRALPRLLDVRKDCWAHVSVEASALLEDGSRRVVLGLNVLQIEVPRTDRAQHAPRARMRSIVHERCAAIHALPALELGRSGIRMGALSRRWGTRGERPKAARRTMPLVSLSRFASMARAVYRGRGSEASYARCFIPRDEPTRQHCSPKKETTKP